MSEQESVNHKDQRAVAIIGEYSWGAFAAMVAIPVPGADIAATCGVWGKMMYEIGLVYGYEMSMDDASNLASKIFKNVIMVVVGWFASAKVASTVLKFFPGVGTVTAYLVDAAIAAIGSKSITAKMGAAAALYFKSGRKLPDATLADMVKDVSSDPMSILKALASIVDDIV